MSCQDCDDFQDGNMTSYYRWKNANIEMRGCSKHLREIFDALNDYQEYNQAKSQVDGERKTLEEKAGVVKEGG